MLNVLGSYGISVMLLIASIPTSGTYKLENHSFGTGGNSSTSENHSLQGISGEQSSGSLSGNSYDLNPGLNETQQANVPPAPAFTNDASWYNKLHLVLDNADNPSDATFLVAISTDDFATTQYVQNDNTVGATAGSEDYRTYSGWGTTTGIDIIGLEPDTTYKVKVKADRGDFTESAYGPESTAATVNPTLTFDIDISSTDSDTNPPYQVALGDLLPDTVTNSNESIWLDFETNGLSGGNIYMYSQNTGLMSTTASYVIASLTGDLAALSEGFGIQSVFDSEVSGGPLAPLAPYDGSGHTVGITDDSVRQVYESTAPVTGGRASLVLKAKAKTSTPSATDYTESIIMLAAAKF